MLILQIALMDQMLTVAIVESKSVPFLVVVDAVVVCYNQHQHLIRL